MTYCIRIGHSVSLLSRSRKGRALIAKISLPQWKSNTIGYTSTSHNNRAFTKFPVVFKIMIKSIIYGIIRHYNIGQFSFRTSSVGNNLPQQNSYRRVIPGGPKKNGTVDTVHFSGLINSFSPCWIEHLFLVIITPRSSNLVENFLFYE